MFRSRCRSKQTSSYVAQEKPPQAPAAAAAPAAASAQAAGEPPGAGSAGGSGAAGGSGVGPGALRASGSAGSLLSVSAGASTILANSTSSLDLHQDTQHNGTLSPLIFIHQFISCFTQTYYWAARKILISLFRNFFFQGKY